MDRKIVDMMGDMGEDSLVYLDLSEDEVNLLTEQLDLEAITEKAKTGIRKTSYAKPKKMMRKVICVAACIAVSGGTVFASQHLNEFKAFFGIGAVISEADITDVGKSITRDGIRMTVNSALAGENDIITLVSFEREDGSAFPESIDLDSIKINTDDHRVDMAAFRPQFSEDRKKLIYCIESLSTKSMLEKEISVTANGLYTEGWSEKKLGSELSDCYKTHPVKLDSSQFDSDVIWNEVIYLAFDQLLAEQRAECPVEMPFSKKFPKLTFAGVGMIDNKLHAITYCPDESDQGSLGRVKSQAVIYKMIDNRTGKTYEGSYSEADSTEKGKTMIVSEFEELGEADLPYLTPVASYIKRNFIAKGPWNLNFTLKKQNKNVSVNPNLTVETENGSVLLTEATISLVGGFVLGEWTGDENSLTNMGGVPRGYHSKLSAITCDGAVIEFQISGATSSVENESGKKCFKFNYEVIDSENKESRIFLSEKMLKSIETIKVDGSEFKVKR